MITKIGRQLDETAEAVRATGRKCLVVPTDVTRSEQVNAMAEAAIAEFGRIDILHNNVGVTHMGGPVELDEDKFQAALDLNIGPVYRTAKAVLPYMLKAGGGAIVNVSSLAALRSNRLISYEATKAALLGLSRSAAGELDAAALEHAMRSYANVVREHRFRLVALKPGAGDA